MERLENNEETPAELPAKHQQALKRDYNLVEFSINTTEDFKKAVKKTKGLCTEFFRRLLNTFNRCQIKVEERLEAFPYHDAFVELLQKRFQEEAAKVQDIRAMDDLILRSQVDHPAISILLLEDQLRLSMSRVEAIKKQAEKFEINIQFLEPCNFEGIAKEATVWRKFLDNQVGPSL